jgi:cell division septation protein DedD
VTVLLQRCGILVVGLALLSQPCSGQQVFDAINRMERLASAGNSSAARALADSLLAASPEGSDTFIEALYWHAVLDSTAAGAERDYLRVVVEYPLAPRASSALLRLAELEMARQARDRARRHLEKLHTDYPKSDQIARAQYLLARMARDDGETDRACALLNAARASVDANDVELKNQITYLHASCMSVAPPTHPSDSTAIRDTTGRPPSRTAATSAKGQFAIQVAAYNTQREATSMARQLQRRGLPARVFGAKAPFRVRVGRYATREEAQRAMTRAGLRGIITEAEPS